MSPGNGALRSALGTLAAELRPATCDAERRSAKARPYVNGPDFRPRGDAAFQSARRPPRPPCPTSTPTPQTVPAHNGSAGLAHAHHYAFVNRYANGHAPVTRAASVLPRDTHHTNDSSDVSGIMRHSMGHWGLRYPPPSAPVRARCRRRRPLARDRVRTRRRSALSAQASRIAPTASCK